MSTRRSKRFVEENHLTQVASVTLEVGEVSGIIPYYLTDCWKWAVEKSQYLKGAELKIETLPAVTYCEDCKQTYPTVKYAKICPTARVSILICSAATSTPSRRSKPASSRKNRTRGTPMGVPVFSYLSAGALSIGIWMISSRRWAAYSSVRAVPPGRPSNAAMRMREASTM